MAWPMKVSLYYGTHLPCLIKAVEKTDGDILELGGGVFSTPYLHYISLLKNRKLVTVENDAGWSKFFFKYKYDNPNHEIVVVDKYADAKVDKPWDIVLIDQTPDSSRTEEALRLKDVAKYIILHDSNKSNDKVTRYSTIYPYFKYKTVWEGDANSATIVSNLVDLEDFWK